MMKMKSGLLGRLTLGAAGALLLVAVGSTPASAAVTSFYNGQLSLTAVPTSLVGTYVGGRMDTHTGTSAGSAHMQTIAGGVAVYTGSGGTGIVYDMDHRVLSNARVQCSWTSTSGGGTIKAICYTKS